MISRLESRCRLRFNVIPRARGSSVASVEVEIEKKFICTPIALNLAAKLATKTQHFIMVDTYFDTVDYILTKKDFWLRERNGNLELKWPQPQPPSIAVPSSEENSYIDVYQESEDFETIEQAINEQLNLSQVLSNPPQGDGSVYGSLMSAGVLPFATIHTARTRHFLSIPLISFPSGSSSSTQSFQDVYVDVDEVTFKHRHTSTSSHTEPIADLSGSSTYIVGEVELCATPSCTGSTITNKTQVMMQALHSLAIDPSLQPVRGKVLEYLVRYRPAHYAALRACGHLTSKGL
jgi:hypothetical protein